MLDNESTTHAQAQSLAATSRLVLRSSSKVEVPPHIGALPLVGPLFREDDILRKHLIRTSPLLVGPAPVRVFSSV